MNWEDIILEFCMDITVRGFSKITIKNYKSKLRNTANFFKSINVEPLQLESNLSYKQAIFTLLALDSLSNDCVGNQVYRDTVQNIIHQTIDSSEMELTIVESVSEIEG
ncbi:hypothetical protein NME83_05375, partial [Enterococcus faecalis]|nr:hypothetical protein [Enterococcus faecalis]